MSANYVFNNVLDLSERNLCITEKLLHQGFRYHKLVKTFTKFYHRYKEIIVNITQHADILYVRVFHIQSFMVIFFTKHKNVSIHLKSLKTP